MIALADDVGHVHEVGTLRERERELGARADGALRAGDAHDAVRGDVVVEDRLAHDRGDESAILEGPDRIRGGQTDHLGHRAGGDHEAHRGADERARLRLDRGLRAVLREAHERHDRALGDLAVELRDGLLGRDEPGRLEREPGIRLGDADDAGDGRRLATERDDELHGQVARHDLAGGRVGARDETGGHLGVEGLALRLRHQHALLLEGELRLLDREAAHVLDRRLRAGARAEPPSGSGGEAGEEQHDGEQDPAAAPPRRRGAGELPGRAGGRRGGGGGRHGRGDGAARAEHLRLGRVALRDERRRERHRLLRSGAGEGGLEIAGRLLHLLEQLAGVGGTVLGIARGRPQHELVELGRHLGVRAARCGDGVVGVLVGDLHRLLALERLLAREHLEHHDADGVDVAAGVGDAAGHQLGGEVGDRAEQGRPGRRRGGRRPGEPEVADLDASVVGEQHVLGFEVAVHDAGAVGRGEAREQRLDDVHGLLARQRAVLLQQIAQRDAGQVLHDEVRRVGILPLIEDVDHVGVGEAGGRARLLDEALGEGAVVGQVPVHDLHGDEALEALIGGEVHGGHSAPRDARAHLVPAVDEPADHRVGHRGAHSRDSRSRGPAGRGATRIRSVRRARPRRSTPTSRSGRGRPRSARPARPA